VDEYLVETDCISIDSAELERWEAVCELFPDLIGLGDTEEEAIAVLIFQITERKFH
jgi:hypothetical protein